MKPSNVIHVIHIVAESIKSDKILVNSNTYVPAINSVLWQAYAWTNNRSIESIIALMFARSKVTEDYILFNYGYSMVEKVKYIRNNIGNINILSCDQTLSNKPITNDIVALLKAAFIASKLHVKQFRKADGSPYINHPIGVANILGQAGIEDVNVLIGALMHDTVEDTSATIEDIEKWFGESVKEMVVGVTDDKSLPAAERKKLQIEHVLHTTNEGVKLIKLADKIHNLQSFFTDGIPKGWPAIKIIGYFVWSREVTKSIQHINSKLNDTLNNLYDSKILIDEIEYPVIPKDANIVLKEYYASV